MIKLLFSLILAIMLMCSNNSAQSATTLLPNGKQCFSNANGPIISGSLNMFFPSTTTPKPNWQDANQVTLNSAPIQLDGDGCAILYGTGIYRQQVFTGPVVGGSTTGTLVWDQLTTDTSAFNSTFWAGLSAGTPNVITIVDPGFNGTDGTVVQFVSNTTNTGPTTVNPSGFGAISVVKDTTAGPVPLTGGEITQGNIISLVYYATSNTFHLLNSVIQSASGSTSPLCGAVGLQIINDNGTPNNIVDITANQIVTQNSAGVVVNRSTISTSVNITTGTVTSTAGGMDGESPGTSGWLYIWLIDNGATASAIASVATGNGLSPNLPSGYTFKCRVGAVRVDGSSNLLRTQQFGARAQYVLVAASNTAVYPTIGNGSTGSAMNSVSLSTLVPATASQIIGTLQANASVSCKIAMNATAAFSQTTNDGILAFGTPASTFVSAQFAGIIESTNIFYGGNGANCAAFAQGWVDRVNAN